MLLRPYRATDLARLYELDRECFTPRFRFSRAMLRSVVEGEHNLVRVATAPQPDGTEEILGFCAAALGARNGVLLAYVSTLDVAPAQQGKGLGQALMRAVEEAAGEEGAAFMTLHVHVGNSAAIRLYERLGYECIGRAKSFYGQGVDALKYRKLLEQPPQ